MAGSDERSRLISAIVTRSATNARGVAPANNSLSNACQTRWGNYYGDKTHGQSAHLGYDDRCGGCRARAGAGDPF
jgi:hypothetical protein